MKNNFKVGDKVVPVSKSAGNNNWEEFKKNKNGNELYYVVDSIINDTKLVIISEPVETYWYFKKSDLVPYEELPEVGELVEVSFNKEDWFKRYFLCRIHPKAENCFVTVDYTDNARYLAGKTFITTDWPFLRRIPKTHKLTIDGSEELELSHESYEALKKHFNNQ